MVTSFPSSCFLLSLLACFHSRGGSLSSVCFLDLLTRLRDLSTRSRGLLDRVRILMLFRLRFRLQGLDVNGLHLAGFEWRTVPELSLVREISGVEVKFRFLFSILKSSIILPVHSTVYPSWKLPGNLPLQPNPCGQTWKYTWKSTWKSWKNPQKSNFHPRLGFCFFLKGIGCEMEK